MHSIRNNDSEYMRIALDEARVAYLEGEVPVGACVVCGDEVISVAHNTREQEKNSIRHAEVTAIELACKKKGSWRLSDCTLYVTLEPCLMCTGALINARIGRVVFGAKDSVAGACGSIIDTSQYPSGLRCEVVGGVLCDDAARLLSDFFKKKRN